MLKFMFIFELLYVYTYLLHDATLDFTKLWMFFENIRLFQQFTPKSTFTNVSSPTQNRSNSVKILVQYCAVLEGAFQGRCASQISPSHIYVSDVLWSLWFHVIRLFSTRCQMRRLRHGLPQEMRETDWKSLRIESKACGGSLAVPQERWVISIIDLVIGNHLDFFPSLFTNRYE